MATTINVTPNATGTAATLSFAYDKDAVEWVKGFAGRSFDGTRKCWTVPLSSKNVERMIAGAKQYAIDTSRLTAAREQAQQSIAASQSLDSNFCVRDGLLGTLRPYQSAAVGYKQGRRAVYIGDEMGLRKTISALAIVHHENGYPACVFSPAVVATNWRAEAKAWLGDGIRVQLLTSAKTEVDPGADIVIASYGSAHNTSVQTSTFATVICDEAHFVKNSQSKRAQAVSAVAAKAESLIMLSGTPLTNKPRDLYAQLELMGLAGYGKEFGGFKQFATRYCGGEETKYGFKADGATNMSELAERMRATCYIRRVKEQVLTELPDLQRQTISVDIAAEFKRELSAIKNSIIKEQPGAVLSALTKSMAVLGRAKVSAALDFIEDCDDKLIVFSSHVDVQRALLDGLHEKEIGHVHILGDDSMSARDVAVTAFQSDASVRVVVCSTLAASVGITLTAASTVLFVEQDFTAAVLDQAEARAHRMGQKNAVNAVYLVARHEIDEELAGLIAHKRRVAHKLAEPVTGDLLRVFGSK